MTADGNSSSSKWTKPLVLFLGSLVISWLALSYYPQLTSLPLSPSQKKPEESPTTTTTTTTEPDIHVKKNDKVDQHQQHEEEIPPDVGVRESEGEGQGQAGAAEEEEEEDESSPVPQRVILENNFETPVDLYWINNHNPDQVEYILIDSSITKFSTNSEHYLLAAKRHDEFVLKDPNTNEIVFEFQVDPPNVGPDGDFFVVAEPPSTSVESDADEEEEDEEEYEEENDEQYELEQSDEGKVDEGEHGSEDNNSYQQSSDEL